MKRLHSTNEMARIDNPNVNPRILDQCEVWIYGDDRSSAIPHFHFPRRLDAPFEVEISLSDFTICKSKHSKGVNKNDILTWKGLENEFGMLQKWLEEAIPTMQRERTGMCWLILEIRIIVAIRL